MHKKGVSYIINNEVIKIMATGYRSAREQAERRKILTIFGVIYAIAIFVVIVLLVTTLSYDRVYDGVYLNQTDVSGMTREELVDLLEAQTTGSESDAMIDFSYNGEKIGSLAVKDLKVNYEVEAIADALYNPGHEGTMFERLSEILTLSNKKLYVDVFATTGENALAHYDETSLHLKVNEIASVVASDTIQHNITQLDGSLRIIAGRAGVTVDKEILRQKILDAAGGMQGNTQIELSQFSSVVKPDAFDVQKIYDTYNVPAQNAKYVRSGTVTNGTVSIKPESNGQSVAIADLVRISQTIETSPDKVYSVEVTPVAPTVLASDLAEPVFTETLGSKTTSFSSSSSARKTNITLATKTVNGETGYILLPGETFSFNDFVGDTTVDKGYAVGIGYEDGEQVETAGGGVCQVTSTLYNAAINAGIEITERFCHSMPVSYVPRGLDAAVSYGAKNLKITNNLAVPIKIVGTTTNSSVTFKIMGVNQNKGVKYTYSVSLLREYKGEDGNKYCQYQTYRTVTVNGKVTEDKKPYNKSTYLIK